MDPRLTPDARAAIRLELHQLVATLPTAILTPLVRLLALLMRTDTAPPGEPPGSPDPAPSQPGCL